ncbi:hypothetical protein OIU77_002646 [Salix suchowensis]|uniref:Uncharacterized protein n=1 Tax=Salix suchowensis TaxID=1278906 RepID=A0ABQ9AZ15_9ROSI|nr:hypothetical protein OIU77_002646 [Salix suchowensis]
MPYYISLTSSRFPSDPETGKLPGWTFFLDFPTNFLLFNDASRSFLLHSLHLLRQAFLLHVDFSRGSSD